MATVAQGVLMLRSAHAMKLNLSILGFSVRTGEKLADIVKGMTAVAEGVLTSRSAHALAQRLGVEAPIIEGIYRVIHEGADPVAVVTKVMRCAGRVSWLVVIACDFQLRLQAPLRGVPIF